MILIDECCVLVLLCRRPISRQKKEKKERQNLKNSKKTKHLSEKRHSSSKSLSAKRQ